MNWFQKVGNALWKTKARRYVLVAVLIASGVGAPAAVSIGTAVDEGIDQMETRDD